MQQFEPIEPIEEPAEPRETGEGGLLEAQSVDQALEQIDRLLHQMLLLAGLSADAGEVEVDRRRLQQALDRLRDQIDRIADSIR